MSQANSPNPNSRRGTLWRTLEAAGAATAVAGAAVGVSMVARNRRKREQQTPVEDIPATFEDRLKIFGFELHQDGKPSETPNPYSRIGGMIIHASGHETGMAVQWSELVKGAGIRRSTELGEIVTRLTRYGFTAIGPSLSNELEPVLTMTDDLARAQLACESLAHYVSKLTNDSISDNW